MNKKNHSLTKKAGIIGEASKLKNSKWLWAGFLVLLLIVVPHMAQAQGALGDWDRFLPGFSTNNQTGEELAIGFVLNLVAIVRTLAGALALVMGVTYGLKLIFSRGQEEGITKQRNNFLWMLLGFLILIVSENIASILNPERATSAALIDFGAARDQLRDIVDYVKWLLGSVIVLYMVIVGVRMITAGGDEEEVNKQKKSLTWGLLGMMTILLANGIVNAVYQINAPDEVVGTAPTEAIGQIGGIIRLILVFMGPIAIIFTIVAGFGYLTALDNEEQATRARGRIVAGIVAIVIIYGAFALVNTITSQDLSLLNTYFA